MNIKSFISSGDYKEFKREMISSFATKPLDIKSTNAEEIVLEVKACQIAIDKLVKAFNRFEAQAKPEIVEQKPFR